MDIIVHHVQLLLSRNSLHKYQASLRVILSVNKMNCELMFTYDTPALRQTGSRNLTGPKNASHNIAYIYEACDQISDSRHQLLLRKM
jgi:hypothetical protein